MNHERLFHVFEPQKGGRVLALALRLKVEMGYAASILPQLGEGAVPLLADLAEDEDDEIRIHVVEILTQIGGSRAQGILEGIARSTTRHSPSARRAAEEIARRPAKSLRIEALGALRVWAGGVERSPSEWRSLRALRLFQVLLLHRFRWVHKDQVLEALWPGGDPERCAGILWQAIRQLRKGLEPDLTEVKQSSYVRFQNEAYRLEPGPGLRYDVIEFEEAIREGESLLRRGKSGAAIERFGQAADLYRGDYLCESPYEEVVAAERERLREELIRLIARILDLHASRKEWQACLLLGRRGLGSDPYNEAFHHAVVQAHLRLGHRAEALAQYHDYE
ncbi:MAG: BTAD domain-containing putative transcriptional regulator, partial [Planctomycetota bacterium]